MVSRIEAFADRFIRQPIQRLRGNYYESPNLVLTDEPKRIIREWVLKPNPRLSEVSFIGVGVKNVVDKVYTPQGEFSSNSGAFYEGFSGSRVDPEELRKLFDTVYTDGRLDQLLFLGHLHPSGEMASYDPISRTIYRHILTPRDSLLYLSEGDFEGAKHWPIGNPDISLPYEAIAANTQDGPKLRIYSIDALIRANRYREVLRGKVPYQTISLD